jgi:flagellar basal body rod protein FlgC
MRQALTPRIDGYFQASSQIRVEIADSSTITSGEPLMSIDLSTALSGISAANERLRASASNVAKLASGNNTQREQVDQNSLASGGVTTHTQVVNKPVVATNEVVEQQSATYAFVANLRVLQTQVRAEGAMLDIHA